MKSFWLGTVAILGMLAVGCSAETDDEGVGNTRGDSTSSSASSQKDKPAPDGESGELEATPAADQSAFAPVEADRSVECTGRDGDNLSLTRILLGSESGIVKSVTVTMTSAAHLNTNAIAVSVRGASDTAYTPAFTSASNIADASTVAVPFPSDFTIPAGGSIKIVTTFEGSWFGDGSGECRIQL